LLFVFFIFLLQSEVQQMLSALVALTAAQNEVCSACWFFLFFRLF